VKAALLTLACTRLRHATILAGAAMLLLGPPTARAWPPGNTTGIAIQFQNLTRHYNVHVPPSYDGSVPVALVLDFHGWMNDPGTEQSLSHFDVVSDSSSGGFIVAYPEGYEGTGSQRSWNAGTCCPPATTDNIDDVGFVRAVVADIESQANIDPRRIYATGLSNGGGMSHRLACEAADLFAAVSPVACPLLLDPFTLCQPIRPISVLHFAGLTDQVVPYNGGESQVFSGIFLPSSPDSFAYWVGTDGCGNGQPEIVEDLGNGASCDTHTTCAAGVEVGFCSIHGTLFYGHVLYDNSDNVNVAQRAWTFVSQFTLPSGITTTTTSSTTTTTLPPPCSPAPAAGCLAALSQKGLVKVSKGAIPAKDKITWKWVSTGAVAAGDFGDPTTTAAYTLCMYGQGGLAMTAHAPSGSNWLLVRTGARYTNKALVPDGIQKIVLKAGGVGRAKLGIKGKGATLPMPGLPLVTPVRVQLVRSDSGACWEASYSSAIDSTGTTFKAKSD
jgi:poly(3-hydroxybutyrate) depolymerase